MAALRLLAVFSCALLISLLGACSGGGSSAPPPEELNVGDGWITIYSTSSYPTEAYLSGSAFISPTWWRCCSGSAEDTGVTVTWTNTTTNTSGPATQYLTYFCFFSSCAPDEHTWSATIPIIAGDNVLLMTAADPAGNIGRAYVTVSPGPPPPDTTRPSVVATSPQDNATGVGVNTSIIATFSEPMDPASISSTSFILNDSGGSPVSGTVSYSGNTATFAPAANLAYASQYTAVITSAVQDIAGNTLAANFSWSFTTGNVPDTSPPAVLSVTPVNNEPCADPSATLSASFSEPIDAATATASSFLLRNGVGDAVIGNVWSSGAVVNFTPTLGLAYNTPYTATLTTALTDLAGNPLGTEFSWGFTTQQSLAGSWQPLTTNSEPELRNSHTAVWTGSEMIVWGGTSIYNGKLDTGARYTPATDSWQPTSTSGAPSARAYHSAVWTGSEMIVWGGVDQNSNYLNSGSRYDPNTDTWQTMSAVNAPEARRWHTAVWTGSEMIVWGGDDQSGASLGNGARYNPIADSWQPVSTLNAPAKSRHTAVWSGSEMIVWGGIPTTTDAGGRYDPLSDSWQAMSNNAAPSARLDHTAVWTGNEMIVWGGYDGVDTRSGGIYDPASDSWRPTSLTCAPAGRSWHLAVWSGTRMIVWGGRSSGAALNSGGTYDPSTGIWQATQFLWAPTAMSGPRGTWTGSAMLIWGAGDVLSVNPRTGGLFTP